MEDFGYGIARPPWGRDAVQDMKLEKPKVCTKKYSIEDLDTFAQFIRDKYKVNWYPRIVILVVIIFFKPVFFLKKRLLDNMPAAQPKAIVQSTERYSIGFDLVFVFHLCLVVFLIS